MEVVLVLNKYTVNPVRFVPLKVALLAATVLNAFAVVIAVTKITAPPPVVGTDNPVTAAAVISLATGFTVTLPILMLAAEKIPVPVIFAKVTLLVVATACPIETVGVDAFPVPPVTVTPVPPDTVAAKSPPVMLLVECVWTLDA